MDPLLETPAGDRLALLSMASHFTIRLPKKSIELSQPPSPWRSPRHHPAPLSPSKRSGDLEAHSLFIDTTSSPTKRSKTEMDYIKQHFTELSISMLKGVSNLEPLLEKPGNRR
jgi:hypothetical protein